MPDEHGSVTGQAGTACASVTCVVVTEQLRAYVVRASESLQHVPQQPCFPSHTSSQNHPLPPLSPFPFICMRSAIPTDCRSCEPACRAVPARVDRRSTVAAKPPSPERRCDAANRPMRAIGIAGACTVTMATVRPNPPAHLLVLGIVMSEKTYTSRI